MTVTKYEEEVKRLENVYETICRRRRIQCGLLPSRGLSTPCEEEPCWEICPWNPRKEDREASEFYKTLSDEVGRDVKV